MIEKGIYYGKKVLKIGNYTAYVVGCVDYY